MEPEFDDLRQEIGAALQRLEDATGSDLRQSATDEAAEAEEGGAAVVEPPIQIDVETAQAVARGLRASMAVAEAGIGECQVTVPYSPMRPVRKPGSDVVQWCCNHKPQHCGA